MVFLPESKLERLRYGMVMRDDAGRLEVHEPAAVARAMDDEEAARMWEHRIEARQAWRAGEGTETTETTETTKKTKKTKRSAILIDTAAVETMWAASTELATRKEENEERIWNIGREESRASDDSSESEVDTAHTFD
ncbi:hypothetical protein F5B18DRAFT_63094 [Nemania serpens]|nr:hypothetical protein F5B18DRAFT_63094 [Nemania serpens]